MSIFRLLKDGIERGDVPATIKFPVFLLTSTGPNASSPVSGSFAVLNRPKTSLMDGSFSLAALLLAITASENFLREVALHARCGRKRVAVNSWYAWLGQ
jgi:hypothetical protein